jgi:lysophospholipase L1-like esterase
MGNALTRLAVAALVAAATMIPAPTARADGASLLVIGDSITCGMLARSTTCGSAYRGFARLEEDLLALGTFDRVTVDAVYSRNAAGLAATRRHGAKTLAAYLRARQSADAVIVALGSNDLQHSHRPAYFEQQIRAVMDAAGGRPVAWVNVYRSDRPYYVRRSATFNAVLARMAGVYPNLAVVDWHSAIVAQPTWQAFDRLHLQPKGYRARVPYYVEGATALWSMLNPPQPADSTDVSTTTVAD